MNSFDITLTDDKSGALLWPEEPPRLREENIDEMLMWAVTNKVSDISVQTDRQLYGEIDGVLHPMMRRPFDSADIANFLNRIYGPDAIAKLAAGKDLDLSYEIKLSRNDRVRFRVNITPILARGRDAVQATLRVLPNIPPSLHELGIEQEIIDAWAPRQGLILVTGPTGSGKSTLLAAGNRMLIERPQGCGKMLTYEAPIEYVYDAIVGPQSLVAQTEIPRHLPNFAAGVRNALRRKPAIIVVGEARDRETVGAAIEAAQTGHAVYSTAHTIGVAATIRRMISVFEPGERTERAYALMETLRLIVTQALVPKVGGGRVGVREFLVLTDDLRERLLETPLDRWTAEAQRLVVQFGRPMERSAQLAYEAGLIDRRWLLMLAKGFAPDFEDAPSITAAPMTEID